MMNLSLAFNHLLNGVLPALFIGLWVALGASLILPKQATKRRGPRQIARDALRNAASAGLVWFLGLLLLGQDGEMATYFAICAVAALVQWLSMGGKLPPTKKTKRNIKATAKPKPNSKK